MDTLCPRGLVTVDVPDHLPMVFGGVVEIEQVLVNLLLNARDALEDRPDRRIEIAAFVSDGEVRLTLADTGGGIRPDLLSRIFDPFFTTKPSGKGSGLGLAIAHKTMIALDGTIAVRNTGQGAAFTLVFQAIDEL
jgi:C4-dicarboxylate-specific signal transduction histidine kinase